VNIQRISERVGPTGSLHGEGLENILGRPPFDPLTLVLRESGQNIWDARIRVEADISTTGPDMRIRVRTLTDSQDRLLREVLAKGDRREEEPAATDLLQRKLADPRPVRVMEICDSVTRGLDGPIDPQSGIGNFVRFFFDVGATHFEGGDGGTYGYGRSSLYLIGLARTILVDSLPYERNEPRRFMGCRIGRSYERPSLRGGAARFTGRHFWGVRGEGERVLPLEGEEAGQMATALGMPSRDGGESGTTILIPWPDLHEGDDGARIAQILLHNFWPKLVSKAGKPAMGISVEVDGVPTVIPDPARHRHYARFAEALLAVRTRLENYGARRIEVQKPYAVTGHIAFSVSQRETGPHADIDETHHEHEFDNGIHHVALMRPTELVVRYVSFPSASPGTEWAGVFMCSDEKEIRNAFAASEPPAHDDWIPDRLSGHAATYVRVTRDRRIPDAVDARFGLAVQPNDGAALGEHSLAGAADRFAGQFLSGDGSAPQAGSSRTGTGGRSQPARLRRVRFQELRTENEVTVARFATGLAGGQTLHVRASAMIEGVGPEELPADVRWPTVRGWLTPDGTRIEGAECTLDGPGDYFLDIAFGGQYAVIAKCEPLG
jgi:hypothetical protein